MIVECTYSIQNYPTASILAAFDELGGRSKRETGRTDENPHAYAGTKARTSEFKVITYLDFTLLWLHSHAPPAGGV